MQENLINLDLRAKFKEECIFQETAIFTTPVSTTNTMGGYISGVSFHEKDLIELINPTTDIVICKCNYGFKQHISYNEPVKIKDTNRGRKKKIKIKKPRKKQGDGSDFNSQITFVIRSETIKNKVYKFKVFRTGELQLPGVYQSAIDDVLICANKIVTLLSEFYPTAKLERLTPVMKNYKFVIKIPPTAILDLQKYSDKLLDSDYSEHCPDIFMSKYTRMDTKLSLKFSTPITKNAQKKTRVNIFMKGKVNILGAYDATDTSRICEFLHYILVNNYKEIVVFEGISS